MDKKKKKHLTKSRWPNEYDRNRWTWPKSWQWRTLTENVINITTTTNMMGEYHISAIFTRSCSSMWSFIQVPTLRFVVVNFMWSSSNQFLVILIRSSELVSIFLTLFQNRNTFFRLNLQTVLYMVKWLNKYWLSCFLNSNFVVNSF